MIKHTSKVTKWLYIYIYIYEIQCAHPPHHQYGFVVTCRLWTANGGVHALLVLEPAKCSTSTRLGALIY